MLTTAEENYLKATYNLHQNGKKTVSTNALANRLKTKASSVTDMVKKLCEKNLLNYKKYQGFILTQTGTKNALKIIRKHRLWEVFLVDHLKFKWDEVHDIAEEIEHIKSDRLTNKLDKFLGYPKKDPHGAPIPDEKGKIVNHKNFMLCDAKKGQLVKIVGVLQSSKTFLKDIGKLNITIGSKIKIKDHLNFDLSTIIVLDKKEINLSEKITNNLFVKLI